MPLPGTVMRQKGFYGDHRQQEILFWRPRRAAYLGPLPILIGIHGGNWHSGSARHLGPLAGPITRGGFAFASLGYRTGESVGAETALRDVAAGIAWLVRSSADLQIDRARLGLLGHGSGAHMAVSLALEPALLERTGVDPHAVQTLIAIAGFYGNPKKGRIHDAMTGGDQDLPKAPLDLALKGATGPATLFLHGEGDRAVGLSHSVRMASVMAAAKTPVRLRLLDKTGHWGALYALSWAAAWRTTVLEETRRFASARFSVSTV